MRLTEQQAKALGVTDKQIKEAKLRPATARLAPAAAPTQKSEEPHTVDGHISDAFDVMQWLKEEIDTRFPGEAWTTRIGIDFPCIKFRVEIDTWSEWSARYAKGLSQEFQDWTILRLTASALKAKNRQLEVMRVVTKYSEAKAGAKGD